MLNTQRPSTTVTDARPRALSDEVIATLRVRGRRAAFSHPSVLLINSEARPGVGAAGGAVLHTFNRKRV